MEARCTALSLADAEPLAGTAPTDTDWLLVEHPGPWGRQAVAESRLPEAVRAHLAGLEGVRVQLVRRHGRDEEGGAGPVRVFTASLAGGGPARVRSALLASVDELLGLDLDDDQALAPYDAPLWLVCTNGRRDLCCAELGRPVVAALAARWPEATWETTHLGGHRFSGTLLALPSGLTLGRLDPESAVAACEEVEAGRVPTLLTRGRAGTGGAEQVAELHLRAELAFADVAVLGRDGDTVLLRADDETWAVEVVAGPGPARQQSCADDRLKPTTTWLVRSAAPTYS